MARIGRLNKRVVYEEPSDGTPDALGQVPEDWQTIATVWAEVRSPTGREIVNAGQQKGVISDVVTVRRAQGWSPRLIGRFTLTTPVYDATTRVLNIVSANDLDTGRVWIVCLCTEETEPGEGETS